MTGWGFTDRPAVTVGNAVGRGLIGGTGGKAAIVAALERGTFLPSPHDDASDYAACTRITIEEAAMLQTFPPAPLPSCRPDFSVVALDLFAGAGGWDVAAERLGIDAHGVELMPEAVATRDANGMSTVFHDVWAGLEDRPRLLTESERDEVQRVLGKMTAGEVLTRYDMLIASPPCQKFSMAGKGTGRSATADVLRLIEEGAYRDPAAMRTFAAEHDDDGIALVLAPLAYVWQDAPTYVVLEQVPPVLPVWEAYAVKMREWGYSVAVAVLNAEQYGVPQTRRRAVLIARADGVEAKMPEPTHSRYYSRDPKRLDPGVLPWVSMAEALELGEHSTMRSNYGTSGDPAVRGERAAHEPAATMTSKAGRNLWLVSSQSVAGEGRATRSTDDPALTITSTTRSAQWGDDGHEHVKARMAGAGATAQKTSGQRPREVAEPAHTIVGKGTAAWVAERVNDQSGTAYDPEWPEARPALTVAGRDLVPHPGATANRHNGSTKSRNDGLRVTPEEAAALQSFPAGMAWAGTKTKVFLQIGNAVPPMLASAVLEAATRRG